MENTKYLINPNLILIFSEVAEAFHIPFSDIIGRKRDAKTVFVRHQAIYEACIVTDCTYSEIGRAMGNRTCATITNAFHKISEMEV